MIECNAKSNQTIPCDGDYVESEGLCFRHAFLFDVWICEHDGFRIYRFGTDDPRLKGSTIGEMNPEQLRRWKRAKFHEWLNSITLADVERWMRS